MTAQPGVLALTANRGLCGTNTLNPVRWCLSSDWLRAIHQLQFSSTLESHGAGRSRFLSSLNAGPPTQQAAKMAPSLTVKFAQKDDKLEVTIVRCKDLPDLDGAFNLTDAYVVVKVGEKKERTKAVGGKLDPKFDVETSTFLFDVRSLILLNS